MLSELLIVILSCINSSYCRVWWQRIQVFNPTPATSPKRGASGQLHGHRSRGSWWVLQWSKRTGTWAREGAWAWQRISERPQLQVIQHFQIDKVDYYVLLVCYRFLIPWMRYIGTLVSTLCPSAYNITSKALGQIELLW